MRTLSVSRRLRPGGAAAGLNSTQIEALVAEWVYTQNDPAEELAQLHYFSIKKLQPEGGTEFVITVKEFAARNTVHMRFYAQADKEVNQGTAAFRPFGSGDSLLAALTECVRAIRQYPYEPCGDVQDAENAS